MPDITAFKAKKVVAMDINHSTTTPVAVGQGRILVLDNADCAGQRGSVARNNRLADSGPMQFHVKGDKIAEITLGTFGGIIQKAPWVGQFHVLQQCQMTGRTLGAQQCKPVPEALYAISLGAAYSLRLGVETGSCAVGKHADFANLGAGSTVFDPAVQKDVPMPGTVSGGQVHLL